MDSDLKKNCILLGAVNFFCLSCDKCLTAKENSLKHIQCDEHEENLKLNEYLDNSKADGIRKVKRGYYCELCSVLFVTRPKVTHHLNDVDHKYNKGLESLKQVEDGVLAFDTILIGKKAWNGLVDETCVICEVDVDDDNMHMVNSTHLFNLIQTKLEFSDNNIYRLIDNDECFNCLTCNIMQQFNTLEKHFESGTHEKRYASCKDMYSRYINSGSQGNQSPSKVKNKNINLNTDQKKLNKGMSESEKKPLKSKAAKIKMKKAVINDKTNGDDDKIKCKTIETNLTKAVNNILEDTKIDDIIKRDDSDQIREKGNNNNLNKFCNPMEDGTRDKNLNGDDSDNTKCKRNDKNEDKDSVSTSRSAALKLDTVTLYKPHDAIKKLQEFAKENLIKYKRGAHSAHCNLCNVTIASSMLRMMEHVKSPEHEKCNDVFSSIFSVKLILGDFIRTLRFINNQNLIINNRIHCSLSSYTMFMDNKCMCCGVNSFQSVIEHMGHIQRTTYVLCSEEFSTEFVRETHNNEYHCGFCNILSDSKIELMNHFKTRSHKINKDASKLFIHMFL